MCKVLFVVANDIQVKMFNAVCKHLKDCTALVLCIDKYYKHKRAEDMLKKTNLLFKNIETYTSENPKDIIKLERPDIVVVGHDMDTIPRLFITAANSMGIPTLLVQDGIIFDRRSIYSALRQSIHYKNKNIFDKAKIWVSILITFMKRNYTFQQKLKIVLLRLADIIKGKPNIYGHGECSKIAVMGEFAKNLLVSEGIDPKKIVITGQPRFDDIVEKKKKMNNKRLGTRKRVVVTTEPFVETMLWTEKQRENFILTIVNTLDTDTELVIKLHPVEKLEDYKQILEGLQYRATVCRDTDLYELLSVADLVISVASTTALESIMLDKPVIIIDLFNTFEYSPYVQYGVAIGVYKEENILPAVRNVLYNDHARKKLAEARKKFVYEHAYIQDGKASERVANLIVQMIKESKRSEK